MIIIDKLSYSSGLAHVSPEEKFAYAVLTLLVCVVSRSVAAAVIVLAVNGILNVKKGRVPFYLYLKSDSSCKYFVYRGDYHCTLDPERTT